jgi:hypothetical protein
MAAHSILPPSSASAWVLCPGWVNMALLHPEEGGEAAREGTEAHDLAEQYVKILQQQRPLPDGEGEMHEGAVLYAETMFASMTELNRYGGQLVGTETRVAIKQVHKECFGTVDGHVYDPTTRQLHVWDYKFGHSEVNPLENWQLIAYASGLLDYYGIDGYGELDATLQLGIVQPRAYVKGGPVRTWTIKGSELRGYVNRLANAAQEALSGNVRCITGVQCRYCPGRWNCEAANAAGMALYEAVGEPVPLNASVEELGLRLDLIQRAYEQIGYLKTGLETQIESLIRKGEPVPGWAMTPKTGTEQWSVGTEEVLAVGKSMGVDLSKPGVITPNQARKAGLDKEVVAQLATRKSSMVLTKQDETLASTVFGKGK